MNRRQKMLLIQFIVVIVITCVLVVVMYGMKEVVNRNESMRAMTHLSRLLTQYRQKYGSLPDEDYIDQVRDQLEGWARFGEPVYRLKWIGQNAPDAEVLTYVKKQYSGLMVNDGYVIMRMNGNVEWLSKNNFEKMMKGRWAKDEPKPMQINSPQKE